MAHVVAYFLLGFYVGILVLILGLYYKGSNLIELVVKGWFRVKRTVKTPRIHDHFMRGEY